MASIGKEIDKLDTLDLEVARIEGLLKKAKKAFTQQETKILGRMFTQESGHASGKSLVVTIREALHVSISNRAALEKYAQKNDAMDLFQSRLNSKSYKERVEDGEKIPGIKTYKSQHLKLARKR